MSAMVSRVRASTPSSVSCSCVAASPKQKVMATLSLPDGSGAAARLRALCKHEELLHNNCQCACPSTNPLNGAEKLINAGQEFKKPFVMPLSKEVGLQPPQRDFPAR